MRHKLPTLTWVAALMVTGIFAMPEAGAQNPAPPSLKEQLEAQYTSSKVFTNGSIKDPGTVLVIQLKGVEGVPLTDAAMPTATYKEGALHKPGAGSKFGSSLLAGMANPNSQGGSQETRPFPVGEKVYISKLDVNLKKDRITFTVAECASCNGTDPVSAYKAAVAFQFAKGYLVNASVPEVLDTIANVFAFDTGPAQGQAQQPQEPAAQQAPQPEQPAPPAAAQPAGAAPLTNDDVLKLLSIKLGDSVILAKIKGSPTNFDTSADALAKLKGAGASDAVLQAMIEAGGAPPAPPPPAAAPAPPPTSPSPPAAPACNDYEACLKSGQAALQASQWQSSLSYFQAASSMDPSKPDAWAELGQVYVAAGQYEDAVAMWDKALGLGGTLVFPAWHYAGLHGFEKGAFRLGAKEASFDIAGDKTFSVAPAEASDVKSHRVPMSQGAWSFGMKQGGRGRYYWFSFVPYGVQCETPVRCTDAAGYNQERVVANYVAQTIGKLAPGSLAK